MTTLRRVEGPLWLEGWTWVPIAIAILVLSVLLVMAEFALASPVA